MCRTVLVGIGGRNDTSRLCPDVRRNDASETGIENTWAKRGGIMSFSSPLFVRLQRWDYRDLNELQSDLVRECSASGIESKLSS